MASGIINNPSVHHVDLSGTDTTSTTYAGVITTILTATKPQTFSAGLYSGSIICTEVGSSSGLSTAAGVYLLDVINTNTSWRTQGVVMYQGTLYDVWYKSGVWGVNEHVRADTLHNMFTMQSFSVDNIDVAKSTKVGASYSISKSGYTAIALAGWSMSSASSSGSGPQYCSMMAQLTSSANIYYEIHNHNTSTAAKVKIAFQVVFVKNS